MRSPVERAAGRTLKGRQRVCGCPARLEDWPVEWRRVSFSTEAQLLNKEAPRPRIHVSLKVLLVFFRHLLTHKFHLMWDRGGATRLIACVLHGAKPYTYYIDGYRLPKSKGKTGTLPRFEEMQRLDTHNSHKLKLHAKRTAEPHTPAGAFFIFPGYSSGLYTRRMSRPSTSPTMTTIFTSTMTLLSPFSEATKRPQLASAPGVTPLTSTRSTLGTQRRHSQKNEVKPSR